MGLLQERAPASAALRAQQGTADRRATLLAALGFCFTLAAILGLPGNPVFMGAAPCIALGFGFVALMGIRMERFRGGFARVLLAAGALAFLAFGVAYAGRVSTGRVLLAYFVPAALFLLAAITLAAPRRQPA